MRTYQCIDVGWECYKELNTLNELRNEKILIKLQHPGSHRDIIAENRGYQKHSGSYWDNYRNV